MSLFHHKIINREILNNIKKYSADPCNIHTDTRNLLIVPFSRTQCSGKRFSVFISIMVNKVLRFSSNLSLKDFISNLFKLHIHFSKFILIDSTWCFFVSSNCHNLFKDFL